MKYFVFYLCLLAGLLSGCEQGVTSDAPEKLSVEEIAAIVNADPKVERAYALRRSIDEAFSLAILAGASLPSESDLEILVSTDEEALKEFFEELNFPEPGKVAAWYAEGNAFLPFFKANYAPLLADLTEEEKIELIKLLPPTTKEISAERAISELQKQEK
ncbi:hypothetical protein [Neolewinella agarilytica]|uniref:Uncharacterized protein n=1 Tax=Neolewinella agarilytica TaxID=478744 RepID=A0A1H9MP83_9BACT|nr:hypothetical protein [Neolewinella agarilytica]SER25287.1 hypothetical protein SAMN05444359_13041 [Neolewinella agarilytica]